MKMRVYIDGAELVLGNSRVINIVYEGVEFEGGKYQVGTDFDNKGFTTIVKSEPVGSVVFGLGHTPAEWIMENL